MMIDPGKILEGFLLMLIGSLSTAAWNIGKTLFNMKRDLDFAFQKIRAIEKELDDECSLESSRSTDCSDGTSST